MAVPQSARKELRQRAEGQCECTMKTCDHTGRCKRGLSAPHWEAHHRSSSGPATLGNLTAMCARCHKKTRTYGRS